MENTIMKEKIQKTLKDGRGTDAPERHSSRTPSHLDQYLKKRREDVVRIKIYSASNLLVGSESHPSLGENHQLYSRP